jgi:hypothetical protein
LMVKLPRATAAPSSLLLAKHPIVSAYGLWALLEQVHSDAKKKKQQVIIREVLTPSLVDPIRS